MDHKSKTITWQSYVAMSVEMECLRDNKFPNGNKLTQADIIECNRRIADHTEVLKAFNCNLPVLKDKAGDQLNLF